jgi:hypothetical protein
MLFDVEPRAEGAPSAPHHDNSNRKVVPEAVKIAAKFLDHRTRDRVETIRPVESEPINLTPLFN